MDELQLIIDMFQNVGMWAVFAWLYYQEKQQHNETRKAYFDDLRELAGVKPQLRQNPQNTQNLQDTEE